MTTWNQLPNNIQNKIKRKRRELLHLQQQATMYNKLGQQHNQAQQYLERLRMERELGVIALALAGNNYNAGVDLLGQFLEGVPEGPQSKNSRRLHAKAQKRKIHKGPKGGKFYMKKGKKVYI